MHGDPRKNLPQDYEALVQLSEEMLGVVDFDGRLLVHNPAWEGTFDFPRTDSRSPDFLAVVHPSDREKMQRALRRAALGEDVPPVEVLCRRRAGGDCWISWRLTVPAGEKRCRVAGRDITSSKAITQDPRGDRRLAELGLVAAVVAHDFNNVLSIIRGCASMLRILPGLTPAQAIELDDLIGGVRYGSELVQQVFAYSRQKPPQYGDMDLNKVIAQMGWMLRRLGRKNIGVDLVLGRQIVQSASALRFDVTWAAIVLGAAMGIVFYLVVAGLERLLIPWHGSVREGG